MTSTRPGTASITCSPGPRRPERRRSISSWPAVGAEDLGYGPARAFTSGEVQSIDTALRGVPEAELRRRFDPPDMLAKEIYPAMWDRPPAQQDTLGYLLEYVGTLKEFVERTARRQLGLVIYLS